MPRYFASSVPGYRAGVTVRTRTYTATVPAVIAREARRSVRSSALGPAIIRSARGGSRADHAMPLHHAVDGAGHTKTPEGTTGPVRLPSRQCKHRRPGSVRIQGPFEQGLRYGRGSCLDYGLIHEFRRSCADSGVTVHGPSTAPEGTTQGPRRIGRGGIKCPKEPWCSVRRHGCKHLRRQSSDPSTPSGRTEGNGHAPGSPSRLSTTFEVSGGPPRMSSTSRPQAPIRRPPALGVVYGSSGQSSAPGPSCGMPCVSSSIDISLAPARSATIH